MAMTEHAASVDAPHEVSAGPGKKAAYYKYRTNDALYAPYRLPYNYVAGIKKGIIKKPDCPLIVCINARSGGGDGPSLALALSRALGRAQVFDISEHRPDVVLKRMWLNFQAAENSGDRDAAYFRQRLRIIVAGGDGTIAWVLATIKKLNLHPEPGVAIIPLGTGNDLSRSFGWGGLFIKSNIKSYDQVCCTLMRVACAKPDPLDCWSIQVHLPRAELVSPMPHCISLSETSEADQAQQPLTAMGMFWNYLSVGLDAKAAYGFHQLREAHPALTAGRMSNQMWYSWFSCTSGWFCGAKPITQKAKLSILTSGSSTWEDVKIKDDVRAIVLLNLQSYAGGRQLWGAAPLSKKERERGLKEPSYNDGLLEVVGLTDGYHTGMVMATSGNLLHARRICQAAGVRLSLRAPQDRADGNFSHCFLQVDGEPWRQSVPLMGAKEPLTVEIRHAGTSQLYHNYHNLDPADPKAQCRLMVSDVNMTPNASRPASQNSTMAEGAAAKGMLRSSLGPPNSSRLGDMSKAGSNAERITIPESSSTAARNKAAAAKEPSSVPGMIQERLHVEGVAMEARAGTQLQPEQMKCSDKEASQPATSIHQEGLHLRAHASELQEGQVELVHKDGAKEASSSPGPHSRHSSSFEDV